MFQYFNAPGDVAGPPVQFGPPVEPTTVKGGEGFTGTGMPENDIFYFHPDHLGGTSYITTKNGSISQHVEYIAFGEVLFEEHSSSFSSPYLFNGKELDRETNLSYYGARYLDMKTSLWLNVDPLALYNPMFEDEFYFDGDHNDGVYNSGNLSNFNYCYQNPIKYVDPNGKQNVAGVLLGAVVGGGIELGTQLLSGKSLDQVDWADVGIESAKGAMIGFNPALTGVAETAAIALKSTTDYTNEKGFKTIGGVIGDKKDIGEVVYDAGADFIGGKIGDFGMKKVGKMAEGSVKKMIKAETKAVKEVVRAENKFIKATKGGTKFTSDASKRAVKRLDVANSAATVARKKTVRAQMIKGTIDSPVGGAAKGAAQNTMTDKIKDFFGIGN
ncbi:RHS repeat-associated core domain-containing protein [Flavobacterium sp. LHD-85]|uniref:RHS repeat domain-containing protein n=1 Tax=Flavobacterium sp. LHD-85 TaxID=3071410 RepID=UPI0027DED09E|nr:RHS repeat-associated core domain-containing protein [Flavobacterium sp. LHD-85]MDQ6531927.1 RHS repeat-associated core domain-containing protein [Flavobacterium sp. LHD-85]